MKLFKIKETDVEMRNRIVGLAKPIDCGMLPPPMDAQVAMHELTRHLLGDDFYIVNPVNSEQANTEIVYEIESIYKNKRKPKKYRLNISWNK